MAPSLGIRIGIGGGGRPAPSALAVFVEKPTISEVTDAWVVEWGAEQITISAIPTVTTPVVTWGNEQFTITG